MPSVSGPVHAGATFVGARAASGGALCNRIFGRTAGPSGEAQRGSKRERPRPMATSCSTRAVLAVTPVPGRLLLLMGTEDVTRVGSLSCLLLRFSNVPELPVRDGP